MAVWLTDGKHYLGPYAEDEVMAIRRGVRELAEVRGATDVWRVAAPTRAGARDRLAAHLKTEKGATRPGASGCVAGL